MPKRGVPRRRGALVSASLLVAAACAGCGEVHFPSRTASARPLTVAVEGAPSGLYAALFAAAQGGAFRAGSLRVTIAQPPGGAALAALEAGRAGVAVVSEPELIAARAGGARLVAIGALLRQPLDGIVSLAARPLTSVGALAGRTLALAQTALARAELATVLARARVARSRVHVIALAGDGTAALRSHRAAATLGANWALQGAALAQSRRSAKVLEIQSLGVPTYSQLVLVVRVGEAHYQAPLLRAFLQSLTRGQRAAAADPRALAATLARLNPRLSAAFERSLLAAVLPLAAPAQPNQPFGYQDPYRWVAFGAWMQQHGLIADGSTSGLAITDEFLPGKGEATVGGS